MTIVSTNPCSEKQPYAWSKCEVEPGLLAVGPRYGDGEKEALAVASMDGYGIRNQTPDQTESFGLVFVLDLRTSGDACLVLCTV
jgi:hypothetical protein